MGLIRLADKISKDLIALIGSVLSTPFYIITRLQLIIDANHVIYPDVMLYDVQGVAGTYSIAVPAGYVYKPMYAALNQAAVGLCDISATRPSNTIMVGSGADGKPTNRVSKLQYAGSALILTMTYPPDTVYYAGEQIVYTCTSACVFTCHGKLIPVQK